MSWTSWWHGGEDARSRERREQEARRRFERAAAAFQAEATVFGARFIQAAEVRRDYARAAAEMSERLRRSAEAGRITWEAAAREAGEARNALLSAARGRTWDMMRAVAERLKAEGLTFEEAVARYTARLHRAGRLHTAEVARLTEAERALVMREIVGAAGRANPDVTAMTRRLGRFGRAFVGLSIAIALHNIATAEDRPRAAAREASIAGGGLAGAALGGAAAGLVCGPGAPVCSTIGVLVGGGLFALGVDWLWD